MFGVLLTLTVLLSVQTAPTNRSSLDAITNLGSKCPYLINSTAFADVKGFLDSCGNFETLANLNEVNRRTEPLVLCAVYYENFINLCNRAKNEHIVLPQVSYNVNQVCEELDEKMEKNPKMKTLQWFHGNCHHFCETFDRKVEKICTISAAMANAADNVQIKEGTEVEATERGLQTDTVKKLNIDMSETPKASQVQTLSKLSLTNTQEVNEKSPIENSSDKQDSTNQRAAVNQEATEEQPTALNQVDKVDAVPAHGATSNAISSVSAPIVDATAEQRFDLTKQKFSSAEKPISAETIPALAVKPVTDEVSLTHVDKSQKIETEIVAADPVRAPVKTAVQAPVKTAVQTPVQIPVQAPVKTPVQAPVQAPVQIPDQTPVQAPVKTPVQAPVKTPVQAPAQVPAQTPVDTAVASPPLQDLAENIQIDDTGKNEAEQNDYDEEQFPMEDSTVKKKVEIKDKIKEKTKPLNLGEDSDGSSDSYTNQQPIVDDSYFFRYFMVVCVFFVLGYVGYHNKQKIFALLLEGKKGRRQQRRRPNSANYHKLDSNLEEAVTSSCNKNTTNVIY